MEFTIEAEGQNYHFELDEYGQIWHLKQGETGLVIKEGIVHTATHDVERAKKIAKEMLYRTGYIDK